MSAGQHDAVNHPRHYTSHASGIECVEVAEHCGFSIGNAVKYLWRCDEKNAPIEDVEKAAWYVRREFDRRSAKLSAVRSGGIPFPIQPQFAQPEWRGDSALWRFVDAEPSAFKRDTILLLWSANANPGGLVELHRALLAIEAEVKRRKAEITSG